MRLAQLEAIMREKNISRQQLAEGLGVTYSYLSKRILGYIEFDIGEVRKVIKCLNLNIEETIRCFYLN